MDERWGTDHIVSRSSWPTSDGDPWNAGTSAVAATATGHVLWSLEMESGGMACGPDGSLYVADDHDLVALDSGAEEQWRVRCDPSGYLAVLADGRLLASEAQGGHRLAVRSTANGEMLAGIPGMPQSAAVTPQGEVAYAHRQAGTPPELRMSDLDGNLKWTAQLADPGLFPVLALQDLLLLGDGGYLKAFDAQGRLLWIADEDDFREVTPANLSRRLAADRPGFLPPAPVSWVGGSTVLVGFWPHSYRLIDVAEQTMSEFEAHLPATTRAALPSVPDEGVRLVAKSWTKRDRLGFLRDERVAMHDLGGHTVWEHSTGVAANALICDGAGKTVLACSPAWEAWETGEWSDALRDEMLQQCYVRCLNARGEPLFTWHPGGPFYTQPAIGAAGEIYVNAQGKLWAIG